MISIFAVILFLWCSAPSDLWEGTGQEVASALRAQGLPIGPVVTMERRNRDAAREALRAVREADKVKGQRSLKNLIRSSIWTTTRYLSFDIVQLHV